MADTATVSGKMLHRPLLKSELPSGVTAAATPNVNNETWALAHVIDSTKWDVARQCGSMNNVPSSAELQTLHSGFSTLGWPSSISFPYLSTDKAGSSIVVLRKALAVSTVAFSLRKRRGLQPVSNNLAHPINMRFRKPDTQRAIRFFYAACGFSSPHSLH